MIFQPMKSFCQPKGNKEGWLVLVWFILTPTPRYPIVRQETLVDKIGLLIVLTKFILNYNLKFIKWRIGKKTEDAWVYTYKQNFV